MAKHNPKHIYLGARNAEKADAAISEIRTSSPNVPITHISCDLASLASVRDAAANLISLTPRLDLLFNNAGIMAVPPALTPDGYEIQFGTNHVGHALLTKLLLPLLLKTAALPNADVRIIILSSLGHTYTPSGGIRFDRLRTTQTESDMWARYGQSKLANLLYSAELARRYPSLTAVSVHPGFVETGLADTLESGNWHYRTLHALLRPIGTFVGLTEPCVGAANQLWAATAERGRNVVSGKYYRPVGVEPKWYYTSRNAKSEKMAAKLWEWTEAELKGWMGEK